MKKLWLLLLFCSLKIFSYDAIERAIMDSDPEQLAFELKNISRKNGPLSERKIMKYLDLAQQIITKRYDQIYFDKIWPEYQPYKAIIGILGIPLSFFIINLCDPSKSERENAAIINLFLGTLITSTALLVWGIKDLNDHQQQTKDLYEQSLKVKQIIYDV